MPVEAYGIAINLVGSAEKVVSENSKVIASLERVQASLKSTQTAMNDMVASLRGAGRVASSLASTMAAVASAARDAATASGRIRTPSGAGGGGFGGEGFAAGAAAAAMAGSGSRRSGPMPPPPPPPSSGPSGLLALPPPGGGGGGLVPPGGGSPGAPGVPPGGIPISLRRGPRFRMPSLPALPSLGPYGALLAGYVGAHTVADAYEQGIDADDILAKMAAMQVAGPGGQGQRAFTPAMVEESKTLALRMQRSTPGLGYSRSLDIILQTAGLLGNARESMQLAPALSFDAQVLSRYGKGDAVAQIEKAVQAGELTGLTGKDGTLNVPRLVDFVNRLTQTSVAMGGQLDLGKYQTGLKQFGVGSDAASLDFLTQTLPAYMKIMGEAKAGTALTSLQQVMLAHAPNTRSSKVYAAQIALGLRDSKGVPTFREDMQRDPQAYFMDLLMLLNKHGYRTPNQITDQLYKVFPRQTVDRLAASSIFDRALIDKEIARNRAQQQAGNAPLSALLNNAPGAQVGKMAESFKALEAVTTDAAMQPTMTMLDRLTKTFENITDYVKGHPDDVRMFVSDVDDLLKMVLGVARGIGSVYSALPGPLRSAVLGAVGGGIVGSVVPGVGTGIGIVAGAAGGLAKGVAASVLPPARPNYGAPQDYMVDGKLIHPQAYTTSRGASMPPLQINFMLDGRKMGQAMVPHLLGPSGVHTGTTSWDPSSTPLAPGFVPA